MSRWVLLADRARKDLAALDPPTRRRIVAALDRFAETGHGDIKKLAGGDDPTWRLRVGDWRAIIDLADETITVLRVINRRDAYR